ncbi:MAG: hypothetical protein ACI4GB_04185 [Acutalibacteraceae bacterium]
MFVRVLDQNSGYYRSMVYAMLGTGWFLRYIVINPHSNSFVLVDYLDKHTDPAKPLVEVIQSDYTEFKKYSGSALLKYKYFCKEKNISSEDIGQIYGYPDVCENYAFLSDILTNKTVPVDRYPIQIHSFADQDNWNYVLTQSDADDFMKVFAGFHDSTLEKTVYLESDGGTTAFLTFDNSGWFGVAELCFEGIQTLKIVPASENYTREIFEASLIVENESIFWADTYLEKPDETYSGSIVRALCLKWRKIS